MSNVRPLNCFQASQPKIIPLIDLTGDEEVEIHDQQGQEQAVAVYKELPNTQVAPRPVKQDHSQSDDKFYEGPIIMPLQYHDWNRIGEQIELVTHSALVAIGEEPEDFQFISRTTRQLLPNNSATHKMIKQKLAMDS